ncbi:hypothetical protein ACTG9Q_06495 [Actinokineospora sp. 24-640]
MPRRNRPHRPAERPLGGSLANQFRESGADGEWLVRTVPGSQAVKIYRCPGCDHEIRPGTAHLVVWSADDGVSERRHWHSGCWSARSRRRW